MFHSKGLNYFSLFLSSKCVASKASSASQPRRNGFLFNFLKRKPSVTTFIRIIREKFEKLLHSLYFCLSHSSGLYIMKCLIKYPIRKKHLNKLTLYLSFFIYCYQKKIIANMPPRWVHSQRPRHTCNTIHSHSQIIQNYTFRSSIIPFLLSKVKYTVLI